MKKIIYFILAFIITLMSEQPPNFIISDYDFTNQKYSDADVIRFYKSYNYNRFTDNEIKYIIKQGRINVIHPLVIATKLEQENSLTRNNYPENYEKRLSRALAYGLYIKETNKKTGKAYCPFIGFEIQMTNGIRLLRYQFDKWQRGTKITLIQGTGEVIPVNAATATLYRFCPVYGEYDNCGTKCTGNKLFVNFYKLFKERWELVNKK